MTRTSLAGRTVLAIFAHPDDESLACGGTLARCAAAGARVVLLCASHGEAGIAAPGCTTRSSSAASAAASCNEAAAALGIAEVIVLDHPDGDLPSVDATLFRQEIVLTCATRPDVVITFGRTGSTGIPTTSGSTSGSRGGGARAAAPPLSTTSFCRPD